MTLRRLAKEVKFTNPLLESLSGGESHILNQEVFMRMMAIERKRVERSGGAFLLMLLESSDQRPAEKGGTVLVKLMSAMQSCTRETDIVGWYNDRNIAGVMFTGLVVSDKDAVPSQIVARVRTALREKFSSGQLDQISFSFHFFPDDWKNDNSGCPSNQALYPDLLTSSNEKRSLQRIKRLMDIAGSTTILIVCAPLFAMIAVTIKVSSKGPVLFKQERVGEYGRSFTFLKFRSMHVNNDQNTHKEYVERLIAGEARRIALKGDTEGVYKLANDTRVTRVGKFLRRSSLDELPQFLNVLKGEMSLVGPRPPIPYELAVYQTWHRRRVLQVKPGITGPWQIAGRSRVKFDDMVRMDLRYAMSWSPSLDFKILLRTPGAVIKGAY